MDSSNIDNGGMVLFTLIVAIDSETLFYTYCEFELQIRQSFENHVVKSPRKIVQIKLLNLKIVDIKLHKKLQNKTYIITKKKII